MRNGSSFGGFIIVLIVLALCVLAWMFMDYILLVWWIILGIVGVGFILYIIYSIFHDR